MEIKFLNCTACGASIQISGDMESLNCSACGAFLKLEQGPGYSALKAVKRNCSGSEKREKERQDAPGEGTHAMRMAFRRNHLVSMDTRLRILRCEIREFERQAGTPAVDSELTDLHWQEYQLLERIKKENIAIAELEPVQLGHNLPFMQAQVVILEEELAVLAKLAQTSNIKEHVECLQAEKTEWAQAIFEFNVITLKQSLPSFKTNLIYYENQAFLVAEMWSASKDLETLLGMQASPEVDAVEAELRKKYAEFEKNWRVLEERRIKSGLRYDWTVIQKTDHPGIIHAISVINLDLAWLNSQKTNQMIEEHIQQLGRRLKELEGWQMRIERQASSLAPVGAAGCAGILSGAGVGVALATLANRIFPLPDQNAPEIPAPDAASADDLPPAATRPVQWIVGILVLMLVPAISTLVFFIVGAFILDTKETGSSMALSFTLTGQAMGVVLGCLGFFYSIVPGAGIWPDWVRQMAREMNRSDDPLPRFRQYDSIFKVVVLGLAGMATVVNSFYVMIVIFSWFNQTQPVFIYFVPWIALAIFAFIMVDKMNAPI